MRIKDDPKKLEYCTELDLKIKDETAYKKTRTQNKFANDTKYELQHDLEDILPESITEFIKKRDTESYFLEVHDYYEHEFPWHFLLTKDKKSDDAKIITCKNYKSAGITPHEEETLETKSKKKETQHEEED